MRKLNMEKPCRLELNNSGAWKLIARFDGAQEKAADAIMTAAAQLALACSDPGCGAPSAMALRVATDDPVPFPLVRWTHEVGYWFDAQSGKPV